MAITLQAVMELSILAAVTSFAGIIAMSVVLAFNLDSAEVQNRTGRSFIWQLGDLKVPVAYYKEKVRPLCRVRDWCMKIFFASLVIIAIVFVVSEMTGLAPKSS